MTATAKTWSWDPERGWEVREHEVEISPALREALGNARQAIESQEAEAFFARDLLGDPEC